MQKNSRASLIYIKKGVYKNEQQQRPFTNHVREDSRSRGIEQGSRI